MVEYQVTCINKPNPQSQHQEITHIGNLADQWRLSLDGVIYQIEKKVSSFYVFDPASRQRCYLEVVRELGKRPYLKAHVNGKWTDHLLALEECDDNCRIVS